MINDQELQTITANQRFLAIELMNRGIEVYIFDWANEVLGARYAGRHELFLDIDSTTMPYAASIISGSKSMTRRLLSQANVSVPVGYHFPIEQREPIYSFVNQSLTFPLVVKPSVGNQGYGVHTGIDDFEDLSHALQTLEQTHGSIEILIEEQFAGKEFRIFITKNGDYAVLHRDPAYVIGDGIHTIEQLAKKESERRLNPRTNCLCAIELDTEAERFLRKQGLKTDSILVKGKKQYVRGSSNVKMGGVPEDYTDRIHPDVLSIAWAALNAIPGLPYAGIDFMTSDISAPQTPNSYCVLEINSVPGIGMHMAPGQGQARNVAGMIVDLVFPESIRRMAA